MRLSPANLLGGFYADSSIPWSAQDTVNYIPEVAQASDTRTPAKLRGAPGLKPFVEIGEGAIRGARNVEGKLFVVSGNQLYQISNTGVAIPCGTIPGVGLVAMGHNQITGGNELLVVNGSAGYVFNTVTSTLTRITDPGYPGAVAVDYIDSYLVQVEPRGRFWFHSNLADASDYNTLDRYEQEADPDAIVTLAVSQFEVVVFGKETTEFYYNAGGATGTFQSKRVVIQRGCAGRNSLAKLDNSLFWLGDDGVVYRLDGYAAVPISTPPIEQAISGSNWANALAYTYESEGHKIYYLTFPDGKTWGYDVTTKLWHRRESYGFNRWRLNTLTYWNGRWIGGDFQAGKLYTVDWDYMLEGDQPLVAERVSGVTHSNQNRVSATYAELIFDTGHPETVAVPFPEQPDPPTITGSYPDGLIGEELAAFPYTLAGGTPPYVVTKRSGAFPTGIGPIATTGIVPAGTPTTAGVFTWKLRNTDSNGLWAEHDDDSNIGVVWYALNGAPIGGEAEYARSGGGADWTQPLELVPGSTSGYSFIITGKGLVVFYSLGPGSAVSDDSGATWTLTPTTPEMDRRGIYHGDNFYAGCMTGTVGIYKSPDGVTWTNVNVYDAAFDMAAIEDRFVIVGGEFAQYSDDECATVTQSGAYSFGTINSAGTVIAQNGEKWVVGCGTIAGPGMSQSENGLSWSSVTHPFTTGAVTCIHCNPGGVWVAATDTGRIAYSEDGDEFVMCAYQIVGFGWREVAFGGGRWVIVGDHGEMATSLDGITWTDLPNMFGTTAITSVAATA